MSGQDGGRTWAVGRLAHFSHNPDNISGQDMLSSGCDDCECRVLLPKGVQIGEHAMCHLGESGWSCSGQRCALRVIRGGVSTPCTRRRSPLSRATQLIPPGEEFYPADFPPSLDISHPEFRPPTFHIWISHIWMGEKEVSTSPVRHIRIF